MRPGSGTASPRRLYPEGEENELSFALCRIVKIYCPEKVESWLSRLALIPITRHAPESEGHNRVRAYLRRLGILEWARPLATPLSYWIERRLFPFARPRSAMWLRGLERRYASERVVAIAAPQANAISSRKIHFGGDRMSFVHHNYAPSYAKLLRASFPRAPRLRICLVEIGILRGTGLAIWSDYFPHSRIIGLDHDLSHYEQAKPQLLQRGAFRHTTPEVHTFDAYAPQDPSRFGISSIDIVIDDGPHTEAAILETAKVLAPLLAENFLYIIEDNVSAGLLVLDVVNEFRPARAFASNGLAVIAPAQIGKVAM